MLQVGPSLVLFFNSSAPGSASAMLWPQWHLIFSPSPVYSTIKVDSYTQNSTPYTRIAHVVPTYRNTNKQPPTTKAQDSQSKSSHPAPISKESKEPERGYYYNRRLEFQACGKGSTRHGCRVSRPPSSFQDLHRRFKTSIVVFRSSGLI
ncbi:hypothetical protein BT63DRAFT_210823 [Microthyrium microscopicum]|uniref:Uncharacterized protein n=1 Tax=Microthyrium microscopicum TaxID=703497 RepID=A0A6A6UG26_9PEZI|nr:hypothetical protein BT63DRAFT_210823 [Microthyrium microscopicum]